MKYVSLLYIGLIILDDPLGSQDSLIVAGSCLLAANAGSNDISTFRIIDNESIEFVEKVPSGGNYPVSLTHRDGLVYSLNAGLDGDGGNPGSIQGFHLLGYSCKLKAIGDSIPLGQSASSGDNAAPIFPASPAQIGFSPEGNIILTIKSNGGNNDFPSPGSINMYSIDKETGMVDGLTQTFVEGNIPFSFDFDKEGNFLLVEAFGSSPVGSPNAGRVTMYKNIDGAPSLIQAGGTGQTTSCWIRYNKRNSCAYTTNNGGSSITSFRVSNGSLELFEEKAASLDVPIDFSFSPDQNFLYAVATGHISGDPEASQPAIYVYEIKCNCRLTKVQRIIDGIPNEADREINANGVANGIVGLAVY